VTPEEAAAQRVTTVLAERDAVQANLLELDGSFAKQVLEGAALTGQTRDRWAAASATLATLWENYLAYSAAVDRIAALGTGSKRPARKDLPELNELLTGGCVRLAGAPVPLARRDLVAATRHARRVAWDAVGRPHGLDHVDRVDHLGGLRLRPFAQGPRPRPVRVVVLLHA